MQGRKDLRHVGGESERGLHMSEIELDRRGLIGAAGSLPPIAVDHELGQRRARLSALQRRFRKQHQARHGKAPDGGVRAVEAAFRRIEVARIDGCARADQRCQARCRATPTCRRTG